MREKRRAISSDDREQAAQAAARLFEQHPIFQESRHIACYIAFNSEFDAAPIIDTIWQAQKMCYLPIITASQSLEFVRYKPHDELQKNKLSILEPVDLLHKIQADKLDLVVAPLVGFANDGTRLGAGGGYYDRTFAFKNDVSDAPNIYGLAFSTQECDEIESEKWDIKLNGIITEKEIKTFS